MYPPSLRVYADEVSAAKGLVFVRGAATGLPPLNTGPAIGAPTPGTLPRVRVTVKAEGPLAVVAHHHCHRNINYIVSYCSD